MLCSAAGPIGSYREYAIAIDGEAGDSLTSTPSIDQSGFARKERNLHCDVHVTYPNTYCRRLGRQTLSGWRDRSDPDVAIKAYGHKQGGNCLFDFHSRYRRFRLLWLRTLPFGEGNSIGLPSAEVRIVEFAGRASLFVLSVAAWSSSLSRRAEGVSNDFKEWNSCSQSWKHKTDEWLICMCCPWYIAAFLPSFIVDGKITLILEGSFWNEIHILTSFYVEASQNIALILQFFSKVRLSFTILILGNMNNLICLIQCHVIERWLWSWNIYNSGKASIGAWSDNQKPGKKTGGEWYGAAGVDVWSQEER